MILREKGTPFFLFLVLMLVAGFSSLNAMAETVNINQADAEALQQNLSGIGPVKAKAIIDYRKTNGAFKSVEDIQKVPGIGEALYKRNRNNLSTTKGLTRATVRSSERSALNDESKRSPADRKTGRTSEQKQTKPEKSAAKKQDQVVKKESNKSNKKDTKAESRKSSRVSEERETSRSKTSKNGGSKKASPNKNIKKAKPDNTKKNKQ